MVCPSSGGLLATSKIMSNLAPRVTCKIAIDLLSGNIRWDSFKFKALWSVRVKHEKSFTLPIKLSNTSLQKVFTKLFDIFPK